MESPDPALEIAMNPTRPVYLGDSVYATVDRGMIMLYTDNCGRPENIIFLEPETYTALVKFVTNLK